MLCLEWAEPPFAAGHWVPEMVEAVGATNLLGAKGEPSRTVTHREIRDAYPEVLVYMPCGYYLEEAEAEGERVVGHPEIADTPAVRNRNAFAVDATSFFSRPGPRIVDGLEILAWAVHPEAYPEPPPGSISRVCDRSAFTPWSDRTSFTSTIRDHDEGAAVTTTGEPIERRLLSTSVGTHRGAFTALDWALFASIGAIWGSSFLLIAIGLDAFEPGLITWLRVALGAATLWLVPAARRPVRTEDRARVLALSFLWVALPFTLFPLAQRWISSGLTGLLNGALPIFATAIGAVMLRRLPARTQAIGLVVGFAGVTAIAAPSLARGSSEALGVALVLAAVACYGVAINIAAPAHAALRGAARDGSDAGARDDLDGAVRTRGSRRLVVRLGPVRRDRGARRGGHRRRVRPDGPPGRAGGIVARLVRHLPDPRRRARARRRVPRRDRAGLVDRRHRRW